MVTTVQCSAITHAVQLAIVMLLGICWRKWEQEEAELKKKKRFKKKIKKEKFFGQTTNFVAC